MQQLSLEGSRRRRRKTQVGNRDKGRTMTPVGELASHLIFSAGPNGRVFRPTRSRGSPQVPDPPPVVPLVEFTNEAAETYASVTRKVWSRVEYFAATQRFHLVSK